MVPPKVSVIRYTARDGKELTGYLTLAGQCRRGRKTAAGAHASWRPEARDTLTFNSWVQYLVARGYAVFQPNFRGSGGFGRAFADSGYREWGRRMQDDLTDGVSTLVKQGASIRRACASSAFPTAVTPRSPARRSHPISTSVQYRSPASPISTP